MYPCFLYLKTYLQPEDNNQPKKIKHTVQLRRQLLKSLKTRFGKFVKSDVIVAGTFLDPRFGTAAMDEQMKTRSLKRMRAMLTKQVNMPPSNVPNNTSNLNKKSSRVADQMKRNFIFNTAPVVVETTRDSVDIMLEEYIRKATLCRENCHCPLEFWKDNEFIYPELAVLARKYLSIQASSGACERMFSLAGHIFSLKRRCLGHSIFSDLVFLKLNEFYLN